MERSEFIVGIDIGTTKIVVIAGRLNQFGKVEIISLGRADSHGVKRGVVANIDKTVSSIEQALQNASTQANIDLNVAYVGIAGQHIKSLQHRGVLIRDDHDIEISKEDILELKKQMYKLILPPGDKIIHVLPQEFIVDGEQGIKDPVGMAGIRLEANFHMITGQITAAKNIQKCVNRASVEVADLVLEPLASAEAVLSPEELEAGVALVDIGGGTTDIAIFQDGIIRHTAVIPFGGDIVTEDIKEGCMIMRNQAELLKKEFGSALSHLAQSNEIVAIPRLRGREPKEISMRSLAQIIQARMEEILEQVRWEIRSSGFENKLIAGIVLTGGGSQLKHIVQLTEYITGIDARVGLPTEHLAKTEIENINHPMYATAIGLLIKGAQAEQLSQEEVELVGGKILSPKLSKEKVVKQSQKDEEHLQSDHVESASKKQKKSWIQSFFNPSSLKKWFDDDDFVDFE